MFVDGSSRAIGDVSCLQGCNEVNVAQLVTCRTICVQRLADSMLYCISLNVQEVETPRKAET